MKNLKKVLLIVIPILLIAGAGGGYWWYSKSKKVKEEQKEEAVLREERQEAVEDQSTEEPARRPDETITPTTTAPVQEIKVPIESTTLTASLMKNAVTIGATSYPADSIILLFYPGPGTYNVQKNVGGVWTTTVESVKYSGSGGLNGGFLAAGEDNVQLRVQKVQSSKVVAESKVFIVKRSDLALGIKTYN